MRSNLHVVLDTNVVVSAALSPRSLPGQVLYYAIDYRALIISEATLSELIDVLLRPRFDSYLEEEDRVEFITSLRRQAGSVVITQSISVCRDPRDDKFLELALSGRATHVVSGDRDLLALHPFRDIPILTPRDFLDLAPG